MVYDGSWFLPSMNRDIWAEHQRLRIQVRHPCPFCVFLLARTSDQGGRVPCGLGMQNARFFDIDEVKDTANPLPHMLPPPAVFAAKMSTCAGDVASFSTSGEMLS